MEAVFKPSYHTVAISDFKDVMMSTGERLSEEEVAELLQGLKLGGELSFNYEEFIKTITAKW